MIVAAIAIVTAWASLLGTAYAARAAGLRRATSVAAVAGCYAVLAALALLWLGWDAQGWLGAGGMLLPYAAATLLLTGPRSR